MNLLIGKILESTVINVCYIIDEKYFQYFLMSLYSLIKNKYATTTIHCYIVFNNVSKDKMDIVDIFQSNTFIIHKISTIEDKYSMFVKNYISNSAYTRLRLTSLLPNNVDKVIYLDSDTIIVDDIAELFNTQLDDNLIGGCRDLSFVRFQNPNQFPWQYMKEFKLCQQKYFNAGILLMNIEKLRIDNYEEKTFDTYKNHPEFMLNDQDILNWLYDDRALILHPKWNNAIHSFEIWNYDLIHDLEYLDLFNRLNLTSYKSYIELAIDTKIYHFLGDKQKILKNKSISNIMNRYNNEVVDYLKSKFKD